METSIEHRVKGQLPHLEGGNGKKGNERQILESPRGCRTHQPSHSPHHYTKEILEISLEHRVKGQLPHLEGGDGKKGNGRQIFESPRGCGTHQPSGGTFPRIFKAPDVTLCINNQELTCPTLFLPSRGNRCWGIFGEGRTGDLTTLGPSSGYQHSCWFPWGEWPTWSRPGKWHKWCYAALYKDLVLLSVTIYSCVYTSPKHIFLHQMYRNAIRTIFTQDQFTHLLPTTV